MPFGDGGGYVQRQTTNINPLTGAEHYNDPQLAAYMALPVDYRNWLDTRNLLASNSADDLAGLIQGVVTGLGAWGGAALGPVIGGALGAGTGAGAGAGTGAAIGADVGAGTGAAVGADVGAGAGAATGSALADAGLMGTFDVVAPSLAGASSGALGGALGAGAGAGIGSAVPATVASTPVVEPSVSAPDPSTGSIPKVSQPGLSQYMPKNLISSGLQNVGVPTPIANTVGGAAQGAGTSALRGGNPVTGALTGGAGSLYAGSDLANSINSGVSSDVGGGTIGNVLGNAASSAVGGGLVSAVGGGNPLQGALGAGATSGLATGINAGIGALGSSSPTDATGVGGPVDIPSVPSIGGTSGMSGMPSTDLVTGLPMYNFNDIASGGSGLTPAPLADPNLFNTFGASGSTGAGASSAPVTPNALTGQSGAGSMLPSAQVPNLAGTPVADDTFTSLGNTDPTTGLPMYNFNDIANGGSGLPSGALSDPNYFSPGSLDPGTIADLNSMGGGSSGGGGSGHVGTGGLGGALASLLGGHPGSALSSLFGPNTGSTIAGLGALATLLGGATGSHAGQINNSANWNPTPPQMFAGSGPSAHNMYGNFSSQPQQHQTHPQGINYSTYGEGPAQSFFGPIAANPMVAGIGNVDPTAPSTQQPTGGILPAHISGGQQQGGMPTPNLPPGALQQLLAQFQATGGMMPPNFGSQSHGMVMAEGGSTRSHPMHPETEHYVRGPGDGRSDDIDAKLSNGEYVFDAETVSHLGNGSNDAGAKRLDEMRERIRAHKGKSLVRGKISPDAKEPMKYLSSTP